VHALKTAFAAITMSALTAFGLLAALPAAPVAAQQYPPNQCSLALSVSVAVPGETIISSSANCSSGFTAGATVTITLESVPVQLATVTADANGQFSTPITIPGNAELGPHTVVATGQGANGSTLSISAGLTLVSGAEGARGAARGGALPFTGSDSLPLVWIALALLTVGTALVLAVRRRAQTRRSLSS
jgi:hypothetical protein